MNDKEGRREGVPPLEKVGPDLGGTITDDALHHLVQIADGFGPLSATLFDCAIDAFGVVLEGVEMLAKLGLLLQGDDGLIDEALVVVYLCERRHSSRNGRSGAAAATGAGALDGAESVMRTGPRDRPSRSLLLVPLSAPCQIVLDIAFDAALHWGGRAAGAQTGTRAAREGAGREEETTRLTRHGGGGGGGVVAAHGDAVMRVRCRIGPNGRNESNRIEWIDRGIVYLVSERLVVRREEGEDTDLRLA